MLQHLPTEQDIATWKTIYMEYKPRLKPNRITGSALYHYLSSNYPLKQLDREHIKQIAVSNILENECYAQDLPTGVLPDPICSLVLPNDAGASLYRERESIYQNTDIVVCIDLNSGYFFVEGSSLLWDDLFAHRGLNENDLNNYYSVAEYVACLDRFGMLEQTLSQATTDK